MTSASHRVECFAPELAADTRVVVLGSMPGVASLRAREYYAHPRNRFWRVMERVVGLDPQLAYEERLRALAAAGIGLWDVIHTCARSGSLDGSIVRGSEVPNDFARLLRDHAAVRAFAFNGRKAFEVFRTFVAPGLNLTNTPALLPLPSTSPANAGWSLDRLAVEWRRIQEHV